MITVYHNARCSKSNSVCALLKERNVKTTIIKYLDIPFQKKELTDLLALLQMQPSQLIRKKEPIYKTLFAGKEPSEQDYLKAMVQHPILIERPIIVKDGKAIIGRPPEKVLELL